MAQKKSAGLRIVVRFEKFALVYFRTTSIYCMEMTMSKDEIESRNEIGTEQILRKDAPPENALVDVTALAQKAGFEYPVTLTPAVYERCVKVPEGARGQNECARLCDILTTLANFCQTEGVSGTRSFKVLVQYNNRVALAYRLKAVFHSGDAGERGVTIMLPSEEELLRDRVE